MERKNKNETRCEPGPWIDADTKTVIDEPGEMAKEITRHKAGAPSVLTIALVLLSIIVVTMSTVYIFALRGGNEELPNTRDLFTLASPYNMTVVVVFDEEPPVVEFVNPAGVALDTASLRYRVGSNFTQYFLPGAMVGTWSVNYDPLSNAEVSMPYSVYMDHIFIRDFDASRDMSLIGGILPVSFAVSADYDNEVSYELYAIFTGSDNFIDEEVFLVRGQSYLNQLIELQVDTYELYGKGGFMLRLVVSVQHGQAAIQDTAWFDLRIGT